MRVAVVGAGIGGLAVAGGLRRGGAEVTAFEARPMLRTQGVALSLFANGLSALDALGSGEEVRALGLDTPPDIPAGVRDSQGTWLSRMGSQVVASAHVVPRSELHAVLASRLEQPILTGVEVERVSDDGRIGVAGVGSLPAFDLVVAADGVRSRLRAQLPGDPGVRYSGYYAWRGLTGLQVDQGRLQGLGELWGSGRRFGMAPLRSGRFYWFATAAAAWDSPPGASLAAVQEHFRGWHRDVAAMLDATDAEDVSQLPICALPSAPNRLTWGRTVLLGDAAHAMTPDLCQGANQALEDAAQLVHSLGSAIAEDRPAPAVVSLALSRYEAARRPRVARLIAGSRRMGRLGQLDGGLAVAARNAAMRLTPTAVTDRAALSLQDWTPQ